MNKSNGPDNVKKADKTTACKDSTKKGYARGQNRLSLANLQKWPKGVSGNPLGPPKRQRILQESFKAKLEQVIEEQGPNFGKRISEAMADMAWEWLQKAKTVSEFSSLLSQVRETAGERGTPKDDMPAIQAQNIILLPAKLTNENNSLNASYEVIDDS